MPQPTSRILGQSARAGAGTLTDYNDRLPILPSIAFGAFFSLAVAWMLGNICLRRLAVPWTIALGVGAAAESTIVFLLLACGAGNWVCFLLLGVASTALYGWRGRGAVRLADPVTAPPDRLGLYVAWAVLSVYGVLYLINALAPELEPDARAYHLGLTAEYLRLGGFPHRVDFYSMLPQGFEMLFVPAFAFGRHSAARLVHCAFLLASVPLMLGIGRRLALVDGVAWSAALFYFCAPIAGITGTSAYTDAGGVFFTLATFYVLLVWRDTRDGRYLAVVGITAGFCYAIKFPGGLVTVLAVVFVIAVERRIRLSHLALLSGTALAVAAPWILRSWIATGNPVAPLFNRFFRNPYFHPSMDATLSATLRFWWGVPPWRVPYELAVGGGLGGSMGPIFFALPLGLLALRKGAGRLCWIAAALLAAPWFWNTSARFLMPALPFFALSLAMGAAMVLPRQVLWACVALEAVACWPQVYGLYHPAYTWRLERFPWRAALRVQPEQDYLASILPAYHVAQLLKSNTAPGERTYSLITVPTAYTDREVLEYWHSAEAERLFDTLLLAIAQDFTLFENKASWAPQAISALRIRMPKASPVEWQIHDIMLFSNGHSIPSDARPYLRAWPNPWELPLAFDGNPATRWRTWEPLRAGMYVEADFEHPLVLDGAVVSSPTPYDSLPFDFYGRVGDRWHLLATRPTETAKPLGDVRMDATRSIRGAGFHYILADCGKDGLGVVGVAMAEHQADWGVEKVAGIGTEVLFRIK